MTHPNTIEAQSIHFAVGQRVRLSQQGLSMRRHSRTRDRLGTIVSLKGHEEWCVKVKWDGRVTPKSMAKVFLEPAE